MKTNYSNHAYVWDWDDYDRTDEFDFWLKMSTNYGNKILSAMGALGQAGEYMARNGCIVMVLDYTKEMIEEGKKRYSKIANLDFVQADICNFNLNKTFDFCFISSTDLNILPSLDAVKKALCNVNRHLKINGGCGLEILYPMDKSHSCGMKRFDPRIPKKNGITIWKEGDSRYDVISKKQEIHQIIYVEKEGEVESFDYYVTLQLYNRDVLLNLIKHCGFEIVNEYSDYDFNSSDNVENNKYIEIMKMRNVYE